MLEATLYGANGKQWLLTGTESTSSVLSPMEALTTLSGTASRSDMALPGRSGVIPGRLVYGPIETELEFYLHAETGEEMERVYREFRQAWNLWDPDVAVKPATVKILADHPLGAFFFDVWLSQPLAGVPVDMRRRTSATVMVPVLSPKGLARSTPMSGTGTVEITNVGDTIVYPKLTYSGAGGVVVSPSGARFTLPAVADQTTVDLDPQKLRLAGAFPEGVPPGGAGVWVLPSDVTATWEIRVADPWS